MKKLPDDLVHFLYNQGFVIVSTLDKDGTPHSACKGIVEIDKNGKVYLLDLYLKNTYANLKRSPYIAITAVDEHNFKGYCLKGKAKTLHEGELKEHIIRAWEDRITNRLTQRLLKNIREEKGHPRHPEVLLPKPEYMIAMEVDEIIDLTPHHLRKERKE